MKNTDRFHEVEGMNKHTNNDRNIIRMMELANILHKDADNITELGTRVRSHIEESLNEIGTSQLFGCRFYSLLADYDSIVRQKYPQLLNELSRYIESLYEPPQPPKPRIFY